MRKIVMEERYVLDTVDHCYKIEEDLRKLIGMLEFVCLEMNQYSDIQESGIMACLYVTKGYLETLHKNEIEPLLKNMDKGDKSQENL